ncbi:MAG: DUF4384 domain-containing protein [Thermodesulfobacteriota bacterium]
MKRLSITFLLILLTASNIYASQSTIIETDGIACMGYDKSRKQTEEEALANAKKKAVEHVSTYIKSESRLKDFELEKDLIEAYSNATVKVIQEVGRSWYRDASSGDCCQVKIKAEVIPDNEAMERISKGKGQAEDPTAPLNVQLWTEKKEYKEREKIKIYIRGNKPYYARVVYKMINGELRQLLPNPFRENNYFNGAAIYEIPSPEDRFELEVEPPFGQERIIVYASTAPLGEIDLRPDAGVYKINTESERIGAKSREVSLSEKIDVRSRGVSLKEKNPGQKITTAEFSESQITFMTGK